MSRTAEIQEKVSKGRLSEADVLYLAQRQGTPGHMEVSPEQLAELAGGEVELEEALYSNEGITGHGAERRAQRGQPRDFELEGVPESDGVEMTEKDFPADPANRGPSTEEEDVVERTREQAEAAEARRAKLEEKGERKKAKRAKAKSDSDDQA